ncbi:MAG TPA: YggS family pyridoxal phosphate-dependent enzyme [Longilinea sp.]|nr:YggS family pyridoxal phosphate-dependent enzyme [Longilinea sp.]
MSLSETEIRNNLAEVMGRIQAAAASVNRSVDAVKLVVVSKRQPADAIEKAVRSGAVIFGENYAEEVAAKQQALASFPGLQWHMIGHIQSRKARFVAHQFDYVHALDSLDLAKKLNGILAEKETYLPVLLEMNVSSEASKGGWPVWEKNSWDEIRPEIESILSCQYLQIRGLMTMPPLFDNPQEARPFFSRLAIFRDYLAKCYPAADWTELSMGTSADFEIAIQEGSTFVRIGQAILGPRLNK